MTQLQEIYRRAYGSNIPKAYTEKQIAEYLEVRTRELQLSVDLTLHVLSLLPSNLPDALSVAASLVIPFVHPALEPSDFSLDLDGLGLALDGIAQAIAGAK